jgi:hypothetical protein
MSSTPTPPGPPDEGPGPTFPGFKMGMGAPEQHEPYAPAPAPSMEPAAPRAPRSPFLLAVASGVALLVVVVLLILLFG